MKKGTTTRIIDRSEVYDSDGYDFKPLLHSIDKLTQPILESGLIPIVELAKMFYPNFELKKVYSNATAYICDEFLGFFGYNYKIQSFVCKKYTSMANNGEMKDVSINQIELFEKLKEWHFNIYDLPEEMYIEKSTFKL